MNWFLKFIYVKKINLSRTNKLISCRMAMTMTQVQSSIFWLQGNHANNSATLQTKTFAQLCSSKYYIFTFCQVNAKYCNVFGWIFLWYTNKKLHKMYSDTFTLMQLNKI